MDVAAEDHMGMMLTQIYKLPDFSHAYEDPVNDMAKNNVVFENILDVNSPTATVLFSGGAHLQQPTSGGGGRWETDECSAEKRKSNMGAMREMIFRMAAMQPVHIDPESVKPPKRKNVKISTDPQSVAARHRRERISERIRILQRLVPGGTKMDTASMLDEAIHYVKFLKNQVQSLERVAENRPAAASGIGFPVGITFP